MADKEDIITQTLDKDVVGMQNNFADLMLDKIRDAVAERKAQVAQEFMGVNPDDEEIDDEDLDGDEEDFEDEESDEDLETDEDLDDLMDDELDFDDESEDLEGDSDENS
jgi:hypothetical protein